MPPVHHTPLSGTISVALAQTHNATSTRRAPYGRSSFNLKLGSTSTNIHGAQPSPAHRTSLAGIISVASAQTHPASRVHGHPVTKNTSSSHERRSPDPFLLLFRNLEIEIATPGARVYDKHLLQTKMAKYRDIGEGVCTNAATQALFITRSENGHNLTRRSRDAFLWLLRHPRQEFVGARRYLANSPSGIPSSCSPLSTFPLIAGYISVPKSPSKVPNFAKADITHTAAQMFSFGYISKIMRRSRIHPAKIQENFAYLPSYVTLLSFFALIFDFVIPAFGCTVAWTPASHAVDLGTWHCEGTQRTKVAWTPGSGAVRHPPSGSIGRNVPPLSLRMQRSQHLMRQYPLSEGTYVCHSVLTFGGVTFLGWWIVLDVGIARCPSRQAHPPRRTRHREYIQIIKDCLDGWEHARIGVGTHRPSRIIRVAGALRYDISRKGWEASPSERDCYRAPKLNFGPLRAMVQLSENIPGSA
ncbi:hypothetical protein DFP72DRAFT_856573 [Ephemerocybe angulata]|uniref:Uncharacterized protein n=1 Tax=Ephemerocybe angulata TaxID=980116 RepID=A0A8H6LY14_9AGAR|nr:hypothetical protein DFP72DRAFT_856569 [Tulosesus angulatus]KAF6745311.1 hypothetical protein DFP72DRAFT_856573 [Tulosesus angulatus]